MERKNKAPKQRYAIARMIECFESSNAKWWWSAKLELVILASRVEAQALPAPLWQP
jgi:hypothetical protein